MKMRIKVCVLKSGEVRTRLDHDRSIIVVTCSITAFLILAALFLLRKDDHEAAEDIDEVDEEIKRVSKVLQRYKRSNTFPRLTSDSPCRRGVVSR